MDIGQNLLLRGFLSVEWLHLLHHTRHDRPDTIMTNIVWFLWHEVVTPIWKARNDLLHCLQNLTTSAVETKLDERLRWFLDNKHTALSRTDLFLTRYSRDDLPSLSLNAKKEWVRHLELARAAWDIERRQVQKGQTVITKFFTRLSALTIGD